jgi:hypothetical protein
LAAQVTMLVQSTVQSMSQVLWHSSTLAQSMSHPATLPQSTLQVGLSPHSQWSP